MTGEENIESERERGGGKERKRGGWKGRNEETKGEGEREKLRDKEESCDREMLRQ